MSAPGAALVVPGPSDPVIAQYRQRAEAIKAAALAISVGSEEAKVDAVEQLSGIARLKADAEKKRKELVGPHDAYVSGVNRTFREILAPVNEADEVLRRRVREFDAEQKRKAAEAAAAAERARLEADARLKEAAAAEARGETAVAEELLDRAMTSEVEARQAQATAVLPSRSVKTDVGAAHTRLLWTFEVTDIAKVPAEYLEVNGVAVRKQIAAGLREMPGLRIYQEEQLAVRR